MARILLLILLLIASIWLLDTSVGQTPEGEFDVSAVQMPADELDMPSFVFSVAILGCVGFLVFRIRYWGGNASKILEMRPASFKEGPSAFKIMSNGLVSLLCMTGVFATIFITIMEFTGHHEDMVLVAEQVAAKGEKVIGALLH